MGNAVDDTLRRRLEDLGSQGLLRGREDGLIRGSKRWVDVCSNDYLGFAAEPVSRETLLSTVGAPLGAGASRLVHGTRPQQLELERALARWVNLPGALLFSSGYAANIGAVAGLAKPGDLIVSDAFNHASLIDGCRLSGARVVIVPHRDVIAVREALKTPAATRWVVTESYFSMDGTSPNLLELRAACDVVGAGLIVDEAHALGVFGPQGAGVCSEQGVVPDVLIGPLGKAVGAQGAFVAGNDALCEILWNSARSFVCSTAFSPWLAAMIRPRLNAIQLADDRRQRLSRRINELSGALEGHASLLPASRRGPIFPLILGDNQRALSAANQLRDAGFLSQAIRPPTVPRGTARLRLSMTARLSAADVAALAETLVDICSARQ